VLPADADKRAARQDPCGGSWVTGCPTAMARPGECEDEAALVLVERRI
jgi:hypothetical protein